MIAYSLNIALGLDILDKIFPFLTICHADGTIRRLSTSMRRLFPQIQELDPFEQHFKILKPSFSHNLFANFSDFDFLLLQKTDHRLCFKGSVIRKEQHILLLLTPHVTELAELRHSGLTIEDFYLNDATIDHLMLIKQSQINLEELRERTHELQTVLHSLDDYVFEVKEDGCIVNCWSNDRSQKLFPGTDTCRDRNLALTLGVHFTREFAKALEIIKNKSSFNFDFENHELPFEWFNCKVTRIEQSQPQRYSVLFRNISGIKATEKDLRQTKERLAVALQSIRMGVWEFDFQTKQVFWDESMYSLFGVDTSFAPNQQNIANVIHSDDLAILRRDFERIQSHADGIEWQFRILLPQQTIRWVKMRGIMQTGPRGEPQKLTGCTWDITEQMAAEELSQNLCALIEKSSEAFCYFDASGIVLYLNHTAQHLLGLDQGSSIIHDLFEPIQRQTLVSILTSIEPNTNWTGELAVTNARTQEIIPMEFEIFGIFNTNHQLHFYALKAIDIRQRRIDQMNLLQNSKMASLGQMASGVAHEINNPLAIISGKAEILKRRLSRSEISVAACLSDLDQIISTSQRIAKITNGLLSFARNASQDDMIPTSIHTLFTDTLDLISTSVQNQGIELIIDDDVDDLKAMITLCRPVQITQILINLIQNSLDAIENQDKAWLSLSAHHDGQNICIEVSDSGPGIPAAIRDQIMDPFFTTKPVGRGTGLGLSISKQLAAQHHGDLYCEVTAPHTTMVLRLPLVRLFAANQDKPPRLSPRTPFNDTHLSPDL